MTAKQTLSHNTPVRSDFDLVPTDPPAESRVVIVGGGIAGAAADYQFALAGWDNVVLLEQNRIASGTTWHAAGMVGQLRASSAQTKVNKASVEIYRQLQADTGHDPGWLQCGGLQLAACRDRMMQLQRNAAMAEVFGVEANLVTPEQCQDYWPMLNTDDLVGGVYLPDDGRVLPGECTVALAKGALRRGVTIVEQTEVTSLIHHQTRRGIQRITGVETNRGAIKADWVVLAGNMWMRQIGLQAGIDIPVYPCEHHYLVTKPIEGVHRDCPCTRDPDAELYFRALDDGAMKLGAFKKRTKVWQIGDRVPSDFAFSLLDPDWPDFAKPFADLQHRLKGLTRDQVVKFVNGPEAFTPDNHFIMGQPFLTEGLFVMGGWNSAGIACSAGAAKYAVQWIENGGMTLDLASVDVRRFLPFQNRRDYLQDRVSEVLGLHYQMAWPGRQMETSRGVRLSPLYARHRHHNACFGETAGWERPLFYAAKGMKPDIDYSFLRPRWQDWTDEEVLTCREDVAIMDQSTFAKFRLRGADALSILQRLCGANIDVAIGKAVYTGMFNRQGTFEADFTVIREAMDSFYIVTASGCGRKDFDWITRHIPDGVDVEFDDITADRAVVSVMGPHARDRLATLCDIDLSDDAFPFGTSQLAAIARVPVRAIRISYVGELGWELHVANSDAVALWDALHPIRPIGNHAIATMRIEKAYRAIGHDISAAETPLEAGLAFAIDWNKDFIGKNALQRQRQTGVERRLVAFRLNDPSVMLWGGEPIQRNGRTTGYTTSACFSPTLGCSVAMGYVETAGQPSKEMRDGDFAILNLGIAHPATPSLRSPYDPQRKKILR